MKCFYCKNTVDTKKCIRVKFDDKYKYFCCDEHLKAIEMIFKIRKLIFDIFNEPDRSHKQVEELIIKYSDICSSTILYNCLDKNYSYLHKLYRDKYFENTLNKISYLNAVINNTIYSESPKEQIVKEVEYVEYENKYKRGKKRIPMIEFEKE